MKPEDLESINDELFQTLELSDQQYIVGQMSKNETYQITYTPGPGGGVDLAVDYNVDWS